MTTRSPQSNNIRPAQGKPGRSSGFTLTELMVTVGIAGVLASAAGPSISGFVAGQRVKSTATDLYMAMMKARSEALKRNTNVTLTPASGADWTSGWYIPNPSDPGSTSKRLEDHGAVSSVAISGPATLTYRSSGRVLAATAPSFEITATGTSTVRCVSVDLSGRPYQKKSSC